MGRELIKLIDKTMYGRILILVSFVLSTGVGSVRAADYYFSNSGSDSNTGTSSDSPWESVSKIQQTINLLNPGDRIYLEKGSVWYEVALDITNKNGTSSNPIRFEAYGEGEKPKLSGGKPIINFTKSGNIYSATVESSFPRGPIMVPAGILINGKSPDIARSEEFFTLGTNSWTQLYDDKQNWSSNELVGGILIYQPVLWSWSARPITGNTASSLTINEAGRHIIKNDKWMPYYIANLDKYLTADGDWTFKNNTLKVYSSTDLTKKNVQFAVSDSIVAISNSNYLVFSGISFELANYNLMSFIEGSNITIDGCDFGQTVGTGLKFFRTTNLNLVNSYVHDIDVMGVLTDQCDNPIIRHNLFKRISVNRIGLGNYTFRFGAAISNLTPAGPNSYIEYNYFDSVGLAIQSHTFQPGRTCSYSYNYIENHGVTIGDCAAIYTASDWDGTVKHVNNNIIKNAITSGFRYYEFTTNPSASLHPHALYVDEAGYGYHCDSNSIEKASGAFYTNRSHSNHFTNSNVVNGNYNLPDRYNSVYKRDQAIGPTNFSADRDEVKFNNIVLNDVPSSLVYLRHTSNANIDVADENYFYFDENKIANPFKTSTQIGKYLLNWGASENTYSLAQMRDNTDKVNTNVSDVNTVIDPQGIKYSEVSSLVNKDEFVQFFTNFSKATRQVSLGNAVFKDINGNTISGTTTVAPFYSRILFYVSGDLGTVETENYVDSTLVPFLTYGNSSSPAAVNQKPNINSIDFNILQSTFSSTYIGEIDVVDPDEGQVHTFSIESGNDEGLFAINNSGELNFTTTAIDFNGSPEYGLIVRVQDNGNPVLIDEALITVRLYEDDTEENLAPLLEAQTFEANYDMELPELIGVVIASDPNEGQTLSFEIISGNQENLFSLEPKTGEISIVNFPQSQLPGSYDIFVRSTDNADKSLYTEAVITINIEASALIFYIDPESKDEVANGSFEHPFNSWSQVEWTEGGSYLQKRGTVANENKILVLAENVYMGDYGIGDQPILNSEASDYAIKVMEKGNVSINNLDIVAESAIGCVYFIGASCINNSVVNCNLKGADYGLRIIDGNSYRVKYNVIECNVDGIYSIADFAEIYYNIFKGNHKAINISSYSSSAQIYNNVFYNNRQGVSTSYAELSLLNNIFYLTEPGDQAINHTLDKIVSNHNIFYPEQSGFIEIQEVSYSSLDEYREQHGLDLNSFTQDPLFVDVYNDNFKVEPQSKAVDGGRLVGLLEDFLGQVVPSGNAPDIGLFELENPTAVGSAISEQNFELQIFPNPTQGLFSVNYSNNNFDNAKVLVHSVSGTLVYHELISSHGAFSTMVDISESPPGIYYVTVKTGDRTINRKISKN